MLKKGKWKKKKIKIIKREKKFLMKIKIIKRKEIKKDKNNQKKTK